MKKYTILRDWKNILYSGIVKVLTFLKMIYRFRSQRLCMYVCVCEYVLFDKFSQKFIRNLKKSQITKPKLSRWRKIRSKRGTRREKWGEGDCLLPDLKTI